MVSDLGRVKNIKRDRELKPQLINQYLKVGLLNNGLYKNFKVHQLVAIAFKDHIPDGTHKIVVDHINNDPTDNRSENLQLITQRSNTSKDKVRDLPTGVIKKGKYYARINVGYKRYNLGSFDTPEAASAAYQEALSNL